MERQKAVLELSLMTKRSDIMKMDKALAKEERMLKLLERTIEKLYFTDPQQLLDLITELTDQSLFLIQNTARVEDVLKQLQRSIETTRREIDREEEQITLKINEAKKRLDKEKEKSSMLKQQVQLVQSLSTKDEDAMLEALSEKVAEVHRSCVDDRMTNLSTLERMVGIENRVLSLLQSLEDIPQDRLDMIKKIKDSEKRSRQREEKLREQKEKQQERMKKYLERSLADAKKISGRKLMPRCLPIAQKVKVATEDNTAAEEDIQEYLFGSEDTS
uniref:Coiled-coil domain containing 37 n=1 Tax=Nothobranchius korthausae TaxID=1143690 RepID=A0A1A8HB02_9TELE